MRRALAHTPQVVTRSGRDAVVVIAKSDYESLVAPQSLVAFMRDSPLAAAMTASVHGLVFVTRNEADSGNRGVAVLNPWSAE